jgi:hypothetical protein
MATKYLLPCDCGQLIPIEGSQAGQPLTCSCGQTLVAPGMRAMRELKPQQTEVDPEKRSEGQWNPIAGTTFVAGAVVAVVALVVIGFATISRTLLQPHLPVRDELQVQQWLEEIEASQPTELIAIWKDTVDRGLTEREGSPWQQLRQESQKYLRVGLIGGAVLAIGVALAASSVFLKR